MRWVPPQVKTTSTSTSNSGTMILILVILCCVSSVIGGAIWFIFFSESEGDDCTLKTDPNALGVLDSNLDCIFSACKPTYALDATGNCVIDQSGTICSPAVGNQIDKGVYRTNVSNVCTLEGCESGYELVGGKCVTRTISGRWVQIIHSDEYTADNEKLINLLEVQVFDADDENIAKGKPVTGIPDVHESSNLVDGDDTTMAHTTTGEGIHSVSINLESTSKIKKIVITNRTDCCTARAIGLKINIQDTDRINTFTTPPITKDSKTYTFDFSASVPAWTYSSIE